jgi:WD40 repeat protein
MLSARITRLWALVLASLLARPAVGQSPAGAEKDTPARERPARTDLYGDPLPPGAIARFGTVRFREADCLDLVAFAPDGKRLASAGPLGAVLWDVSTGEKLLRLRKRSASPVAGSRAAKGPGVLVFSPNGRYLAADPGHELHVWEVATGQLLPAFGPRPGTTGQVAFLPDGKTLAIGVGNQVQFWDVTWGEEVRQFRLPLDFAFTALALGGKVVAAVRLGRPSSLGLWDVETGKPVRDLPGSDRFRGRSLACSADGKFLAGSWGDTLELWDAATGKHLQQLRGLGDLGREPQPTSAAFSPDDKTLLAPGDRGTLRLWDVASGEKVCDFGEPDRYASSVAFSPDGKLIAAAGGYPGDELSVWEVATGKALHEAPGARGVDSAVWSPGGNRLASLGGEALWVWETDTGRATRCIDTGQEGVRLLAFSRDGRRLLTCSTDEELTFRVWDATSGQQLQRFRVPAPQAPILGLSPDGTKLASASAESKIVQLWDIETGKELQHFSAAGNQDETAFACLVPSPDGRTVVTGGRHQTVCLWEAATGKLLRRFADSSPLPRDPRKSSRVRSVSLSPDGRTLAWIATDPARILVADVGTGRQLCRIDLGPEQRQQPGRRTFSPDGKTIASVFLSDDRLVRLIDGGRNSFVALWEVATGKERGRIPCRASQAVFSTDGKMLVSIGEDRNALVWNLADAAAEAATSSRPGLTGLEARWGQLAGDDAAAAYQAGWALVGGPREAVPWLDQHLAPAPVPEPKRVARLIADLDDERFPVREQASGELARLAESAKPALQQALASGPSPEARWRIQGLLDRLERPLPVERVRYVRAIEVLEQIGTPAAQRVLEKLARGGPVAVETEEARAALERLRAPLHNQP